ncbi:MAG TPA: hypothetical protein PKJ52_06390, partial [Rectinema sp.]|nr:hypothetical protein [Rectinema sp.]
WYKARLKYHSDLSRAGLFVLSSFGDVLLSSMSTIVKLKRKRISTEKPLWADFLLGRSASCKTFAKCSIVAALFPAI